MHQILAGMYPQLVVLGALLWCVHTFMSISTKDFRSRVDNGITADHLSSHCWVQMKFMASFLGNHLPRQQRFDGSLLFRPAASAGHFSFICTEVGFSKWGNATYYIS